MNVLGPLVFLALHAAAVAAAAAAAAHINIQVLTVRGKTSLMTHSGDH